MIRHTRGMATATPGSPGEHTWEEFIELEEDDLRELIDGELIEVEVPDRTHERIVALLAMFPSSWLRARSAGEVLGSGYKVRIGPRRGVMPDLQVFWSGNIAVDQEKGLERGRPDLVVEIISESSRRYDRVTKLEWYASIGVPEYWLVDPKARTIERLVLRDGLYAIAQTGAGNAVFRPASFEDLEIPLGELWHKTPR